MIEHRITFTDEELVASATQDNLSILALTKFLRSLPTDQCGFFKDCRIEGEHRLSFIELVRALYT